MIIALLALQRSIKGPINWNNISIWYLAVTNLHSVSNKHKCRRSLCWSSISCHPRQEMIVFKSRSPFPPLQSHEPLPCSLGDFIAAAGPSSPATGMLAAREPLCWLSASLDPGPLAAEEDMNELWSKPRPKAALWALLQWWLVSSQYTMGCMGWPCSSQGWEGSSAEQKGQQVMKTLIKLHKVKFPFFNDVNSEQINTAFNGGVVTACDFFSSFWDWPVMKTFSER